MKIENINIKNFKFLKNVEEEINGKNVYLVGGNGVGKTSFLDAVWVGLTGKGIPPEPTTNGAKKGLIEIDLGDFIARTKFTKGKPTRFELENKEFTNESERFIKSPRSYMESRIGMLSFDIRDFFAKSDAEKLKYLAKIMDTDFTDLDADLEELMEARKFDKRKLLEVKSKLNYFNEDDANKELVDVVKLSGTIRQEEEKKREHERILEGVEIRRMSIVNKLEQILQLKEEVEKIEKELSAAEVWLEDKKNLPLLDSKFTEMEETLTGANAINAKIKEAKEAKEADEKSEELEIGLDELEAEIVKKREEKAIRISEQINIPGLTYDANKEIFLYEGLPFDASQQNTAAQLIAGMRIASTMLKELKIMKVDASLIDKENFEKVLDWAASENIELFVELVDRDATSLQISVVDE
jgi:DNA repair exonuclease SbcCD ATPase subunit